VKVALVHDWLTGLRGGERVLEQLCLLYPEADIFTLIYVPGTCGPIIERHRIRASFLDRLPKRSYRHYLPLFPVAIESFDLSAYELVISTSHAVAKEMHRLAAMVSERAAKNAPATPIRNAGGM